MKYIVSLFILVFVYSKVSPKHFLHVFKNVTYVASSTPKSASVDMSSTKVGFLFSSLYIFYQPPKLSKYSPKLLSGTSLHTFVEKGISEDEEKLFQLLSKKAAVLTLFRTGLFRAAHEWRERPPLPKICQTYLTIIKLGTRIPYLKKIQKMYKSHDTHLEFY